VTNISPAQLSIPYSVITTFKMGWFWNTTSVDASKQTHPPPAPEAQPTPQEPRKPLSRDEQADNELRVFLRELEADVQPSSTKYNQVPTPLPHQKSSSPSTQSPSWSEPSRPSSNPPANLEEELFPTDMSCRQAFDAAFYCQSMGGQFNNLYRYGGVRSCSENWNDFWFCMKLKSQAGPVKEDMVRSHYKQKAMKYKSGPSSEDVWKSRDVKLQPGEAFSEPDIEYSGTDEEWNAMEKARRQGRVNGTG